MLSGKLVFSFIKQCILIIIIKNSLNTMQNLFREILGTIAFKNSKKLNDEVTNYKQTTRNSYKTYLHSNIYNMFFTHYKT